MQHLILYTLGVGLFLLLLIASIALHELGHLYFAKKFGAEVTEYYVGFGKVVWKIRRGKTDYGMRLIPLGGYVRILGMFPPPQGELPAKGMKRSIYLAKQESNAELSDDLKAFYRLPPWKKFVVMAAGPTVNILVAFFVLLGVFGIVGEQSIAAKPGAPVVATVGLCAPTPADPTGDCVNNDIKSPATLAGLEVGDQVVSFNGTKLKDWETLSQLIQNTTSGTLELKVIRDGKPLTLTTAAMKYEIPDPQTSTSVDVGYLGISPQVAIVSHRHGPLFTAKWMATKVDDVFVGLSALPKKVENVLMAVLGIEKRDPEGPVSVVGGSRFAGAAMATDVPEIPVSSKLSYILLLTAAFNMFLGIANAIPIPPLDGGHMAGAIWESLRNKWASLRGKTLPGPFDSSKLLPLGYIGALIIFAMGIILIVGDFVVPIK